MPRFKIRNYANSLVLGGSLAFLVKASPTGLNTGTNSRSAMGWIYLTDDTVLSTFVQFKCNSTQSVSFTLGRLTGSYFYAFDTINAGNNKTMTAAQFKANFPLRTWIHVAFICTTTTVSLYVNGTVLINASAWGTAINTGTYNNLFLGKSQDSAQADVYWFTGSMKDVVLVNSAVTQTEIKDHYYYGIQPTSTASAYLMSEGTGTAIADSVGSNSLTGTSNTWSSNVPLARRIPGLARPSDIGNLLAWYEADQGVTVDGSGNVSQWDDLSGNGFHMTQATAGLRPPYVASAINGKPGLRITAATDQFMSATTNFLGGATPHSMFCVIRSLSTGASIFNGFLALGANGAGGNSSTCGVDNTNKFWFGGAGYGTPTINTTIANATSYALAKTCDGRRDIGYFNGVRVVELTQGSNYNITPTTTALIGRHISAGEGSDYYISEAAFFTRVLSDSEIQALTNYSQNKYAAGTAVLRPQVPIAVPLTAATGTITVTDYQYLAGKNGTATMTISDYSLMTGGVLNLLGFATFTEGVDFNATTSNEVTASNLVTAINTAIGSPVSAAVGAVITFTVPGSTTGGSITWSTSGVTPTTATVVDGFGVTQLTFGSVYTSFGSSPGYIDPGTSNGDCATAIASWINAQTTDVTALAVGSVVNITADTPGAAGNSINMSVAAQGGQGPLSGGITLSGATLSGGTDASPGRVQTSNRVQIT